jgi:hypothetical protein
MPSHGGIFIILAKAVHDVVCLPHHRFACQRTSHKTCAGVADITSVTLLVRDSGEEDRRSLQRLLSRGQRRGIRGVEEVGNAIAIGIAAG